MVFYNSEFKGKFIGKAKFFERDYIISQIKERKGLTLDLYERALNGLEYLTQLRDIGLDPIFKGGSAVQLLIPENIQRLSIDIDLAIDSSEQEITSTLEVIYKKFNKKFIITNELEVKIYRKIWFYLIFLYHPYSLIIPLRLNLIFFCINQIIKSKKLPLKHSSMNRILL